MSNLDPSDVYPNANLPPQSAQWGRAVEEDVVDLKKARQIDRQNIAGQNRNTAAQLQAISAQLAAIQDVVERLIFTESRTSVDAGFSIPDQAVIAPASIVEFTVPEGFTSVSVFTSHAAYAKNTGSSYDGFSSRVSIGVENASGGIFGFADPGKYATVSNSHTRTFPVTPGESFVVVGWTGSDLGDWNGIRSVLSVTATFFKSQTP